MCVSASKSGANAVKLFLQRVTRASVTIDGEEVGRIGRGYLVLMGAGCGDQPEQVERTLRKLLCLRIFEDEAGKMNRSICAVGGSVLLFSQFTLYAALTLGTRPGFALAAPPALAEPLYELMKRRLTEALGPQRVAFGRFGADMQVELLNDGPVSMEIRCEAE